MIRALYRKVKAILIVFFIKYPIYFLSGLPVRDNKRWVFGSLYGFSDNAKYFYLNVFCNHKYIDAVYVLYDYKEYRRVKKTGVNVCYIYSLKSIFYLFTSKVYIGTHGLGYGVPKITSRGVKYIELWHGTPIKKIGYLDGFSKYKIIRGRFKSLIHNLVYFFTPIYIRRDLFVATSSFVSKLFQKSFDMDEELFVNSYYPRCSVFFWSRNELQFFINKYESTSVVALHKSLDGYDKVFLYMPTFRDDNPDFLTKENFDLFRLNEILYKENSVFYFKLHPNTPSEIQQVIKGFSNLYLLPNTMDVYTLLPKIDVLITDYSSIYIDFMLSKKGSTIFFPFDYDEYISRSRELAFDYNENINGVRVDDFDELLSVITEKKFESFNKERKKELFVKFWGEAKDKKDLVDAIKKTLQ